MFSNHNTQPVKIDKLRDMCNKIEFLIIILVVSCSVTRATHKLNKRFLIFPRAAPTRTQFIAGVGIPVDLERESITTGSVLKGQFLLPYNASQLYYGLSAGGIPLTRGNKNRRKRNVNTRLIAYKALERVLNKWGYDGLECVLKTICEVAGIPFANNFDLFSELFHILFTPSSTAAEMKYNSMNVYVKAEDAGAFGDPCDLQYPRCTFSFVEIISRKL